MNGDSYVVLHVGHGPSKGQDKTDPMIVRDGNPRFDLTNEIWIERLNEQLARNIQTACEPPHHNIDNAGYDRHLYAFVRRVPSDEKTKFQGMTDLHAVVALSRLVNPTSTGDRYSARVFDFDVSNSIVQAIQYRGSPDVFLAPTNRDWLSVADGDALRKLMVWLPPDKPMHKRVHRAYWNHENAMRSYYLDVRWTLVVSGFEALINTREEQVSRQFRDRVGQLASEFQIALTDAELRAAYKLRSKLVHGQEFLTGLERVLPQTRHSDLYLKLESLLRETVKRCLLDQTFGDFFRDASAVNRRWPLSPGPSARRSWLCRKLQSICG